MIEVHRGLFVGSQSDLESGIFEPDSWAIVHACKEPHHREALGYKGRAADKTHPEYLLARRGHRLILNLVDVEDPRWIAPEIMDAAVTFIHENLAALIRRLAAEAANLSPPFVRAHRVPKSLLLKEGEFERSLELLVRQMGPATSILVLLDADDDCAVELAAALNKRAHSSHPHVRVSVVVANKEYEAWFLAAATSLAGLSGLPAALIPPGRPEAVVGAKEWISDRMGQGRKYSETRHQVAFSTQMELQAARTCRSFRKFEKEVLLLLS